MGDRSTPEITEAERDALTPQERMEAWVEGIGKQAYRDSAWRTLTDSGTKGKVLQVVEAVYSTQADITATTYTDTGLTATITPKSSTSKIRAIVSQTVQLYQSSGAIRGYSVRIVRDATQIYERTIDIVGAVGANNFFGTPFPADISKLDIPTIPTTPIPITYKTQAKVSSAVDGATFQAQSGSTDSTITLIEIEPNT